MSKTRPTRREPSTDAAAVAGTSRPFVPLKPRKGLFVALCVGFGVWVGLLTTLYFTTVYGRSDPHAHPREADQPGLEAPAPKG